MVVGELSAGFGLVELLHATVHQCLLNLFDLLEEPVG